MLADVRAAAIDRALVDDDPKSALALAGAVDIGMRHATDNQTWDEDPLTAAMLTVGCLTVDDAAGLDTRAWRPGAATDPLVVAGAAVAVRERDVAVDRAAALADCAPATLDAAVERGHHEKKN